MTAVSVAECTPASTPSTATPRGSWRGRGRPRDSRAVRTGAHRSGEHHVHKEATRATSGERHGERARRRCGGHANNGVKGMRIMPAFSERYS